MREIDFIPDWYRNLRRRRRRLVMQVWLTVIVILGMGLRVLLAAQSVRGDRAQLSAVNAQISDAQARVEQLHQYEQIREKLKTQQAVAERLGVHVPTAHLVNVLADLMPKDMGLVDLSISTATPSTMPSGKAATTQPTSPQLNVRLHGVAPSDVDLGSFLARLGSAPSISNVAVASSRERQLDGHALREFELTFNIDLTADLTQPVKASAP